MKVDRRFEVFFFSETIRPFLDRLDLGIQSLTHGIGDRMYDVRQDVGQMTLDQVGNIPHGLEPTVGRPPEPAFPERFGLLRGRGLPKSPKLLLHGPGSTNFQIQGTKGFEAGSLGLWQVFFRIQPEVFGAFQLRDPSIPDFPLAHGVHRLADMSHDVKAVEDDLPGGLGNVPEGRLEEGIPHVHGDGPDPVPLLRRKRLIERLQAFGLPALSHVFDRSLQEVTDQRHVLVSLGNGFFVHPDLAQGLLLFSSQSPFHRSFLNPPRLIPADPEKSRRTGHIARFQHIDRQTLEQLGEPSPGFGPGNRNLPDSVGRTGDPGNPGMEIAEELATVQMSPDPLLRMVEDRRLCSAFRAGKQNPRRMRNRHVHPLLLHVHRHRVNGDTIPRRF